MDSFRGNWRFTLLGLLAQQQGPLSLCSMSPCCPSIGLHFFFLKALEFFFLMAIVKEFFFCDICSHWLLPASVDSYCSFHETMTPSENSHGWIFLRETNYTDFPAPRGTDSSILSSSVIDPDYFVILPYWVWRHLQGGIKPRWWCRWLTDFFHDRHFLEGFLEETEEGVLIRRTYVSRPALPLRA